MPRPGRPSDAVRRLAWWSSTPTGLIVLFGTGFVLRLALARGGGFPFDMDSFAGWASRLAECGPWRFYQHCHGKFFIDYPPGYLYVLYGLGLAARAAGKGAPLVSWLKIPPILFDLVLGWLVGELATRLAPAGRRIPVRGIAVAAIVLNPAVFFVSAVWGQADSVVAVLVVASLLLLGTRGTSITREGAGVALLAAAIATKPQALFVAPVVVLVLAWRHLGAQSANDRVGAGSPTGLLRLAILAVCGAGGGMALLGPFRMNPVSAYRFYAHAGRTYPVTSVFAFNLWGAVGFWRADSGAKAFTVFGVPALFVGLAAFSAGAAVVMFRSWRALSNGESEGRVLVFGGASITLLAFATLTRIHERYLFLAVALLACLVAFRWLRWALVAMSALYLVNVYFPYVYYLRYVHRPAPSLGGAFDAFYGTDLAGFRLKAMSALIGVASLAIAWFGWRRLTTGAEHDALLGSPLEPAFVAPGGDVAETAAGRPAWSLQLHPIGRRGALLALCVFLVAVVSRVSGLGHPPGMYFDEVYHARTGGEYLMHKEVYEWTHPPLAKELIAIAIKEGSRFGASPPAQLPNRVDPRLIASGSDDVVWAQPAGRLTLTFSGEMTRACRLAPERTSAPIDLVPDAIASGGVGRIFVAGHRADGPVLVRLEDGRETSRVALPGTARRVVVAGGAAFVLTTDGELVYVGPTGAADPVATGAADVAATDAGGPVWASFPSRHQITSWNPDGHRAVSIAADGQPGAIAAPGLGTSRVLVADRVSRRIAVIDTEAQRQSDVLAGPADLVTTVPETGLAWAVGGTSASVIEPRGASVLGKATLPDVPVSLFADPVGHRVVAASNRDLVCIGGHPTFAWRIGSAIAGSAMVALVLLIALRLFGSMGIAVLSSFFLLIEGLAFSISRIAMNDSYVTAFILAAWLCVLTALYRWGCGPVERNRWRAIAWLLAAGSFGGAALASKWVGLYALAGIGGLVMWDGLVRGKESIWTVGRNSVGSAIVIGTALVIVPLGLYVASYIPFLTLGHSFADLARLQRDMYAYHSGLKATHPFGAPWYGWPFGYRAVFLYLASHTNTRGEIWTIPNIVVLWGGIVAMAVAASHAVRKRSIALAVVVAAALIQYLPWVTVTRVTFLYHYLPVVPFLAIALGWYLVAGLSNYAHRRIAIVAVAGAALLFFAVFLPMYEGWNVSVNYLTAARHTLFWILPR